MSDAPRKAPIVAYALYDFANSAFTTVIATFVFATYFTQAVARDPTTGAGQWSLAMAAAGVFIAVVSPICGAIADRGGRRKPWLFGLSILCAIATAALWWVRPNAGDVTLALVATAVGMVGFEMGMVFYNALLPNVAPPRLMGRVSGWAWGTGYAGGLLCLVLALAIVQGDPPPFGLDAAAAEPVRATALLTAGWFALFALPLFLLVREPAGSGVSTATAIREGLAQLAATIRNARRHKNIVRFLIAAMLYTDAVHTIFILGGVYAAATYGMDVSQVIVLGIGLNVTAGLGAVAGGWIDDRVGPKRVIGFSLVALLVTASAVLLAPDARTFWIAALAMSTFFGPVQAASRTLMAKLAPDDERGEMFGLFALSGRATAFLGPTAVGWITLATGNQRLGLAVVLIFLAAGWWVLRGVREPVAAG